MLTDRFIMTSGKEAKTIGYLTHNLYGWHGIRRGLKWFGIRYLYDMLKGRKYWWVSNEYDYQKAVEDLKELKKTHSFDFYYWK